MRIITGQVVEPSMRIEDKLPPYRVWDFQILEQGESYVSVHVGEWFVGRVYNGQLVTVEGRRQDQGSGGDYYVEAESIKDEQARAVFSRRAQGERSAEELVKVAGQIVEPCRLDLPATEEARAVEGWAFDIRDDANQRHSVVAFDDKFAGPVVKDNRAEVEGILDAGRVVHAKRIRDLSTSRVVLDDGRSFERGRRWSLLVVPALVLMAFAPYIILAQAPDFAPDFLSDTATPFLLVWSGVVLLMAAVHVWRYFRIGQRS